MESNFMESMESTFKFRFFPNECYLNSSQVSQLADCSVMSHLLHSLYNIIVRIILYKECNKCDVTEQSTSWDTCEFILFIYIIGTPY